MASGHCITQKQAVSLLSMDFPSFGFCFIHHMTCLEFFSVYSILSQEAIWFHVHCTLHVYIVQPNTPVIGIVTIDARSSESVLKNMSTECT